jgi:hypothetical protein
MSAQRLGSILSNVTGTSKQVFRVNTSETGFELVTPATLPTYTVTNDTTDRIIDANNVNIDKASDVLSTLVKDVTAIYNGTSGSSTFQWSTSEQVWPFEKASDGSTLYAKQINFGSLPNNGQKNVAHGISNFNPGNDTFFMHVLRKVNSIYFIPIPSARCDNIVIQIQAEINGANVAIYDGYDASAQSAIFRVIYKKSG